MGKIAVLAEKPSVGRDLARVLHCSRKGNGFIEGEKYVVTWALGHLVTLADPEEYDQRYKAWNLADLPMLPTKLKLVVIRQSSHQYNIVKTQLSRRDVGGIVIATDAGREGELVARWIIEKAHIQKPLQRLWISSVTDKAIKDGFARLRPGREYDNLFASATARAAADWFVGINATRALTCKYNAQLSCGRVQTPTLAMIAAREQEIQEFKPRKFFGITAAVHGFNLIWHDKRTNDTRMFDKERGENLCVMLAGHNATITALHKERKKTFAPLLYDLTELQRDANKLFGFSAKETLGIMQRLYEQHKILTYPRTDSRYISDDIVETIADRLHACGVGPYSRFAFCAERQGLRGNKHFVDNSKVSDHHAIIPTEQFVDLAALNDRERKIYDLVVRRFIAVLYPPCEYEQTTLTAKIENEVFTAKGRLPLAQGWKEIYAGIGGLNEDMPDDQPLHSSLQQGDELPVEQLVLTHAQTKPPAYFNEATLLSAMENPIKYMPTARQELINTIGAAGGIGTVATRADIIDKLFNNFLVEKKERDIFITSKGRQLLQLVPEDLKSPEMTAVWEQKLTAIAAGRLSADNFLADMRRYAQKIVAAIGNSTEHFRHDNISRTKCPECGKYMLEINGKKGKMLVCQDRECGCRKHISRLTNARCPNCHKKLELHGEGAGQIFVCSTCGYREKLSAFKARHSENADSKASKRDVASYLRKQHKEEEPINSALADALAKLKLK